MPGFVAEDASAFSLAGAFDFQHLIPLKAHETRMCQIERYGEPEHAIRIEEFLRQPCMWQRANVMALKLSMETLDPALHQRALKLDWQVAEPCCQQCFVADIA